MNQSVDDSEVFHTEVNHKNEGSFFEKLSEGLQFIQSNVDRLKQLSDSDFVGHCNEYSPTKLKRFDADVKQTYVDVCAFKNKVLTQPINLDDFEQEVSALQQRLRDFERDQKLYEYGYKEWIKPDSKFDFTKELPTDDDLDGETVRKEELISQTPKSTKSKNRALRSTFKVSSNKESNDKNILNIRKNKGRTPQPYDFGVPSRFTAMPKNFYPISTANDHFNKYRNEMVNSYGDAIHSDFNDVSTQQLTMEEVTIEFTPGLTTKRPAPVPRVVKPLQIESNFQKCSEIEKKITPEQPTMKSPNVKLLKSLKKVATTPEMPKSSIGEFIRRKYNV